MTAIDGRFPLLGVIGTDGTSGTWTGVVDSQTYGALWGRTWTNPQSLEPVAVEIDAEGALDAALWSPDAFTVNLLLHETKDAAGVTSLPLDPGLPHYTDRQYQIGSMWKEPSGRILFSTDFAGTYCEKD